MRKIAKAEPRVKWWKLQEDCDWEFMEEIRQALGGRKHSPDDWATTAK